MRRLLPPAARKERDAKIVAGINAGRGNTEVGREFGIGPGHVANIYLRRTGYWPNNRPTEPPEQAVREWAKAMFHDLTTEEGRTGHLLMSLPLCGFDVEALQKFTGQSIPAVILFLRRAEDTGILSRREGWLKSAWMDEINKSKPSGELCEVAVALDTLVILGMLKRTEGDGEPRYEQTPKMKQAVRA